MARGDEKKEIAKLAPEIEEDATEDFLFSRVRAAGEQDRPIRIDAKGLEDGPRDFGVRSDVLGIVFDAPDRMNTLRFRA